MAQLLPERWKHALSNLRSDVRQALERWLPSRRSDAHGEDTLPVKVREAVGQLRDDITQALERWLPSRQPSGSRTDDWLPSVFTKTGPVIDVEETDKEIIVLAEMPMSLTNLIVSEL